MNCECHAYQSPYDPLVSRLSHCQRHSEENVARLEGQLELVAGSIAASIEKREDSPLSAQAHWEEALKVLSPFAPKGRYSEDAATLRELTVEHKQKP